MSEPTPICCDYARKFVALSYETYLVEDKNYFIDTKPFWIIRGAKFDPESMKWPDSTERKVKYCPHCGQKFPDIKLKDPLPKKVTIIVDGGYYCDTCGERLMVCNCRRPEEMWEII